MASSINASTTTGLVSTADLSGILNLQSNGTTIATVQSTGFSLPTASTINAANTFGFKNRIINGGMTIDQRNAGASTTAINTYTVDRLSFDTSQSGKGTWGQNLNSVTPPAGYTNYLGFQSSSAYSVVASDYFRFGQKIEGFNTADLAWGTANAKTVTLSAWVRSSLTGTFGGAVTNSSQAVGYAFSYSIPVANTWTQISVTVAGPATGTWLTTNGAGIFLIFSLGVGSTFSATAGSWITQNFINSATGAVSVVGTSGATFYITGVQLEVGSQATSFDFRSIGQEFLLCQRYYSQTATYGSLPTTAGISGYRGAIAYATTQATGGFYFPCEMRTTPTVTPYSANGTSGVWTLPGNVNTGATTANSVGTNGFMYFIGSSYTVSTIIYGSWTASAEL